MSTSICTGYYNPTIYKIIWYRSNNSDDIEKYIFVGQRSKEIQTILKHIELVGYEGLSDIQTKKLNENIPSFKTIFGDIIKKIKFIHTYIEDNECIYHLQQNLAYLLNIKSHNHIYLWYYPKNITRAYFFEVVKFIFLKETIITQTTFLNKLHTILGLNEDQLKQHLQSRLPKKYSSITQITFFNKHNYNIEDIINNDDFIELITSAPIALTIYNYIISAETQITYVNYNDPIKTATLELKNNDIETGFIKGMEFQIYKTLKSRGYLENNEIHMISYSDIKRFEKSIPSKLFDYYFTDSNETIQIQNDIIEWRLSKTIEYHNKLKNTIQQDITIKDCTIKDCVITLNNEHFGTESINLIQVFNNFRTYNELPIIKLYEDGEFKNVKIYQQFITVETDTSQDIVEKIIHYSALSRNLMDTMPAKESENYITFITYLEKNSYMNCFLFKTGVFKVSLHFLKYTSVQRVKAFINIANIIIHKIGTIIKNHIFREIETNYIFENQGLNIPRSHLEYSNLSLEYTIETKLSNISSNLFSLIIKKLKDYKNQFILLSSHEPNIKLIYKSIDDFYNPYNVSIFISNYMKSKGGRLNANEISKLEEILETVFYIDRKTSNSLIADLNINKSQLKTISNVNGNTFSSNNHFGVVIELIINRNTITFNFNRLTSFENSRKILQYFNIIFNDIINNINSVREFNTEILSLEYHNHNIKSKKKDDNATSKKSSKSKLHKKLTVTPYETVNDIEFDNFYGDNDIEINYEVIEDLNVNGEGEGEVKADGTQLNSSDNRNVKQNRFEKEDGGIEASFNFSKKGKHKKLKYSNYMSKMREAMDPELYSEISNYDRSCPAQQMRQPYIVSKKELESFDTKALTGAMKYRGNYYICPRIWDFKARKPVAAEDFIKNGLKSPYTQGMAIPPSRRSEQELDDKHTVIIRKPRTGKYWADSKAEKEYPELLKYTGAAAYPGLIHLGDHPKKFCAPCCYRNIPADYVKPTPQTDIAKQNVQIFKQFYGYNKCGFGLESTEQKKKRHHKSTAGSKCVNENYILDKNVDLENCRLGLLPDNLDLLLNNNQNLFLNTNHNSLRDNANCFLRTGIYYDGQGSNFIRCISHIRELYNQDTFKQILIRSLTPELFMTLNNGDLVKIYSSNDLLPNMTNPNKRNAFKSFLSKSPILSLLFDIKQQDIDSIEKLIQELSSDINVKKTKSSKSNVTTTSKDARNTASMKLNNIYMLYQIMTAYTNYINSILNPNSLIDYKHLLDFISRPNNLIFPEGVNILIFDKTTQSIQCNPYMRHTRNMIILINENDMRFTPVYHIKMKHNTIKSSGIIRVSDAINLDDTTVKFLTEIHKNTNLINVAKIRVDFFQNLYFIHSSICFSNKKSFIYMKVSDYIKNLQPTTDLKIIAQILTNSIKVQYLLFNNGYLLPIYPTYIYSELPVRYLNEIELHEPIINAWNTYKMIGMNGTDGGSKIFDSKLNIEFQPTKLITNYSYSYSDENVNDKNKREFVIGIEFSNEMMVPVMPQLIPKELSSVPRTQGTFYIDTIDFHKSNSMIFQVSQLLFQDYLYQQFKFEFSVYINDYENKKLKHELNVILENTSDYYMLQQKLTEEIRTIMKDLVSNEKTKTQLNKNDEINIVPGLSIGTCYTIKNPGMCVKNEFCNLDTDDKNKKTCHIRMNSEMLELFSYLLGQDIINNTNERRLIIQGLYTPSFYISNRLLSRPDEIITEGSKLDEEIQHLRINKYHKNLPLTDFLAKSQDTHILSNTEYDAIKVNINNERIKSINKLSNILANISLDYLLPKNIINTTPFDATGRINEKMTTGACIFPFLDTSSYKLIYHCSKNKKELLTCPTLLNLDKKPVKWGYCPENPEITKQRLKIFPIDTIASEDGKYQKGRCIFPFKDSKNNLQYECMTEKEDGVEFSWCPIKFKFGGDSAPVAAKELKDVFKERWNYKNIFKHGDTTTVSPDFMNITAKGYCQPPISTINNKTNLESSTSENEITNKQTKDIVNKITLENYQPLRCADTPSKGGYSKFELFEFGRNVLKIPHTLMKNGDTIFGKDILCKIINDRFKEVSFTNKKPINVYEKDLDKCLEGEKKGGYKLQDLRELGVQYFGLSVDEANNMDKEKLCNTIIPIVRNIREISTTEAIEKGFSVKYKGDNILDVNNIYKKNIDLCNKPAKRGGYSRDKLKKLAINKLGLQITNDMLKEEICARVKNKLQELKEKQNAMKMTSSLSKKKQYSKRIKTVKLERAKTLTDLDLKNSSNSSNSSN